MTMSEWTTAVVSCAFLGCMAAYVLFEWIVDRMKMRLLRRYIEDPQTTHEEAIAILKKYGG